MNDQSRLRPCGWMRSWATVLGVLFFACQGPSEPVEPSQLEPVPHPDVSQIDEGARRQFEEQRATVEALLQSADVEPVALAQAMGQMGRLYHAYEIHGPAAVCYRNAEGLAPTEFSWPYHLGLLHRAQGEVGEAAQDFRRALEIRPADRAALLHLAEVELALNRLDEARSAFEKARSDPEFAASAHAGLARVAAAEGDSTAAIHHYQEALRLQPEAGALHHRLALAYRRLGEIEAAQAELGRVGTGDATFPDPFAEGLRELALTPGALARRAGKALANDRLDEAVAEYRKAVAADPLRAETRRGLALALVRIGELDGAIAELEEARRLEPRNVWVHFDLGTTYLAKGFPQQAVGAFGAALRVAPDFEAARFNLANTLIRLGRWQEAIEHLERLVERNPKHGRARYLLAMGAEGLGRREEAVRGLTALLEDEPRHLAAHQGLASILLQEGDVEGAIAHYRQAVVLNPGAAEPHFQLAESLEKLGQHDEAAAHFARVVELDAENRGARLREVMALVRAGAYGRARRRLEERLASVPDDLVLTAALARLLATCPDDRVRDGRRALELAESLYERHRSLDNAETLAMALAEVGRFDQAIKVQTALLERMKGSEYQSHRRRLEENLGRFEKGQAVRMQR